MALKRILFVFSCAVVIQASKNDRILRIPLQRMESGLEKLLNRGADIKLIEGIYDMGRKAASPSHIVMVDGKPVPTNDTLPLFKYFDTQYYGIVNIGKPGRAFKMIMDTSWGYSWVPSADCPKTNLACALHERYNHKSSSTYKPDDQPFNISNRFIGYTSKDIFLVGQMNCTNQTFAELTSIPWLFALYESDGTIGLGLRELSPKVTPFFYNFVAQNRLKDPVFSFYINRDPTTPHGGSLFFGGIDTKHNKTAFTHLPVNSPYYWQFAMKKVTVVMSKKSKQDFCVNGCNAMADTSSNTILGPGVEIKAINRLIGASRLFFSDRYLIPCVNEYKGPKVSFNLGGTNFVINGRDYIQKLSYSGVTICLSAFQAADHSYPNNTWSLGGAFLYQYYTAFDVVNREVMIAEVA